MKNILLFLGGKKMDFSMILPIAFPLGFLVLFIVMYKKKKSLIKRCTYPVKGNVVGMRESHSSSGGRSDAVYIEQIHYVCGTEEYTVNGRYCKNRSDVRAVGSIVEIKVNPAKYSEYVVNGEEQNLIWMLLAIGVAGFCLLFFGGIVLLVALAGQ